MTQTVDISKIQLTDDTLTNIQIMAPLLSKEDQCKVYGMLFGILCRIPDSQPQKTAQEERMLVLVCIGCSVVVSVITTKLLAIHYFNIVDGHVDDICNMTKDFVHETESMICRYQQKNDQEE